jgi:hypothetical protein
MELIKYLKKEHFDGLLNTGSIRIGTLKDYKEGEHGEMVADSMEGAKRFSGSYEHLTSESIKDSVALSSIIGIADGGSITNLVMNNITIIEPDFYIFSIANAYNQEDHHSWFKKESYDVAYKILFPKTFFRRITTILNDIKPVKFLGLFDVHYYDEKNGMDFFDPKNSLPAFCLKDHDGFSNQKEIRAVWQPMKNENIHPINLSVRELVNYVEIKCTIENT